MLNTDGVVKLAEALADGLTPDWSSAADSADGEERALIAELRAVASIGGLFASLSASWRDYQEPARRPRLEPGAEWGGLRILSHVGRGRFGDVYRAFDPALDREVALKLIPRAPEDPLRAGEQVVEEGRLMARVHHPNVVAIFGARRIGDCTGLWMEFVAGRTLAQELDEHGPFAAADLVNVGVALCRALHSVHDAGLVHRDVKPQNVMRDVKGRIVLGDFGIGRELCDDAPSEGLAGTPAYIAPELFARQPATPQSDIYSLGALLFHLATGTYPVPSRSLRSLREAHSKGERTSLAARRPDLPAPLTAAVDRALSADPRHRFPTADDMAAVLERGASRKTEHRRGSPRRTIAAAVTAVAFALGSLAIWATRPAEPPVPFDARDWVLVAAFDNRTGEAVLDGTLEYALERELANSSFVNVVPQARVTDALHLMQRTADTRLDANTAREVAVRDGGIRAVIAGRVERLGTRYSATAVVLTAATGASLASVTESAAGTADLLESIGRLALRLRQQLGEALPEAPAPTALPRVTTSSLRALQLYAQAVAMQNGEGDWGERPHAAEALLRSAIAEDPGFASAHMLLAAALRLRASPVLADVLRHAETAVALSGGAPQVERFVNEAELHTVRAIWAGAGYGQSFTRESAAAIRAAQQRAISSWEAVRQLDPQNYQALIRLSTLHQQHGSLDVTVSTGLADLRPHSATWQRMAAIGVLAADARDVERARHYVGRGSQITPSDPQTAFAVSDLRLFDAYVAWARGDAAEARRIGEQAAGALQHVRGDLVASYAGPLFRFFVALGHLDRAEQLAVRSSPNAETIVAVAREDVPTLRAVLRRNYRTARDGTGVASAFVDAGLVREARKRLAGLRDRADGATMAQPPPGSTLLYEALVEGQILLAEGRPQEAITTLETLLQHLPLGRVGDRWSLATRTLADAYAATGDLPKAIALLEAAPLRIDLVMQASNYNMHWLQIRDTLAQLYGKAGRHADAATVDAQLSRLLAVADADHPIKRRLAARAASRHSDAATRPWVLVTTFDNRTGERVLDGTLEHALERELATSTAVRVVSRARAADTLKLMRRPIDTRVDAGVGRDLALRDGEVRLMIAGRVDRIGARYAITADLIQPADGVVVASVREVGVGHDALLPMTARLALALRERTGEVLTAAARADAALPRVTTASLAALQLFSRAGEMMLPEGGWGERNAAAEKLLLEAVTLDPSFASAHTQLSIAVRLQGPPRLADALRHAERGLESSRSAGAVERLVAEAEVHGIRAEMTHGAERHRLFAQAAAAYEAVLQMKPDDAQALICLTNLYEIHLRRPEPRVAMRLADLRPHSGRWQAAAAVAILAQNPTNRLSARRFVERTRRLGFALPDDAGPVAWAHVFDAYSAWLDDDPSEALDIVDRLAAQLQGWPPAVAARVALHLSYAYLSLGRLAAAMEMATLIEPLDTRRIQTLRIAFASGDTAHLADVIARWFPTPGERRYIVPALLEIGRYDLAREAIAIVRADPRRDELQFAHAEGRLAHLSGRADEAIAKLTKAAESLGPLETSYLAEAHAANGRLDRAIETLEMISTRRAHLVSGRYTPAWEYLRLRNLLSELYRRAGRAADAERVDAELRRLLAVADDDHPLRRRLEGR